VFHQRLATETPCHQALIQGAGETGLVTAANGESLYSLWPACVMQTQIDFRQREAEATQDVLEMVYGPHDPLIDDFASAKVIDWGRQYFSADWNDRRADTVMNPIKSGPIDEILYRGQRFDYLVTSNTLTVVEHQQKGFWNDWGKLQQAWDEEMAMTDGTRRQRRRAKAALKSVTKNTRKASAKASAKNKHR
jgi:hypothetical protein